MLLINDVDIRPLILLYGLNISVNTFAGSLMMIINFFFNQTMEKSLFDAIDEEERTF